MAEREWLQSWFKGTPVAIDLRADGAVSVEVPGEYCFDAGSSSIKPALAAVLDKLAESLLRVPTAQLALLAAPDDASGRAGLGQARADQLQHHLLLRGVAVARIGQPTTTPAAAVQVRIHDTAD